MVDIVLIGLGRVGFSTLNLLLRDGYRDIAVIDCIDKKNILPSEVFFHKTCDPVETLSIINKYDPKTIAVALPSHIAGRYVEKLLSHGYNIVDVSFIDQDPYIYDEKCLENNIYYIPDAGFAPGFSNLYIGRIYSMVGEIDKAVIYVGGNPVKPEPPLYYEVTWNAEDLLEEYIRRARIIRNGEIVEIDPLEEIISIEIPGKGVYEGFYSDGLRTLLRNIKAKELYEITIRYPGHLEKIKILRELGFMDRKPLNIGNIEIIPKTFTARLFEEKYRQKNIDEAILYIIVEAGDKHYKLLSTLKGKPGSSAIALYTSLVFTKTIEISMEKNIQPGVQPLEKLYRYYDDYLEYLMNNGVFIKHT